MKTLDAALKYLDYGLACIPVWRDGRKNPKLSSIQQYNTTLPTAADWRRWARRWPDANIAIITGYWRNIICLDFDDQLTFDYWRSGLVEPFNTWIVQTSRGYHVWFLSATDPGDSRFYTRGGLEVLLRSRGAYCIAPPSIHHTGKPYRTINNVLPQSVDWQDTMIGWEEKHKPTTVEHGLPRPYIPKACILRIEDLIPPVDPHPTTRGAYTARCPFPEHHSNGDRIPSAWVNIEQQRFGCNRCWPGQWWDVINLYAMLNHVTNGEAYKTLCQVSK